MYSKKMNKEIMTFGDNEIKKRKFHYCKYPIFVKKEGVDKIIICKKVSFGEKGS